MKIPISRALILIFLSVIVISGPAFLGLLYYQSLMIARGENDLYQVRSIIASDPTLPSTYLAELLGLPENLYRLKRQEMERRLLASPLIKTAKVKKVLPDKLQIDYTARKPVALLADFENVAIDNEGYSFPCTPFFSAENLPSFYLGDVTHFHTALDLMALIEDLEALDLSRMAHESMGKREIIAVVQGNIYLRLNKRSYREEIERYKKIRTNLRIENGTVIDLRHEGMALFTCLPDIH